MLRKIFLVTTLATVVAALFTVLSGCGASPSSTPNAAVVSAVNSDLSIFNPGNSDSTNSTASAASVSFEALPLIWYRTLVTTEAPTITVLSNDGTTATVEVTRNVTGTLYIKPTGSGTATTKAFAQSYTRFVVLTSANGGISWSRAKLTPGLTKSIAGTNSIAADVVISRVVIKDLTATGEVTLFDVSQEASTTGPWVNHPIPSVSLGDTLEVTVYASRPGDGYAPFVYVWPGLAASSAFRRPLWDDGSHGSTAGDGMYVNTTQPLTVSTSETVGQRDIHIGVMSAGTLVGADSYDFDGWHFIYKIK